MSNCACSNCLWEDYSTGLMLVFRINDSDSGHICTFVRLIIYSLRADT